MASPPPPVPPLPCIATVVAELRQGKGAVLPGRGAGLQATLCGKRGRRTLRATEGLSDEVRKRAERGGGDAPVGVWWWDFDAFGR